MVRQAELLAEVQGSNEASRQASDAYSQAMEAYSKACSMTSSEQGDDLPGLLHNWGVGLRSMADQEQVQSCCDCFNRTECWPRMTESFLL